MLIKMSIYLTPQSENTGLMSLYLIVPLGNTIFCQEKPTDFDYIWAPFLDALPLLGFNDWPVSILIVMCIFPFSYFLASSLDIIVFIYYYC